MCRNHQGRCFGNGINFSKPARRARTRSAPRRLQFVPPSPLRLHKPFAAINARRLRARRPNRSAVVARPGLLWRSLPNTARPAPRSRTWRPKKAKARRVREMFCVSK